MMTSAATVDFNRLTHAYNHVFTDAFTSRKITPENLKSVFEQTQVDLDASQILIEDDRIIGFGFLGIRGQSGWITSVGIEPDQRGRGLGRDIMQALIHTATSRGLSTLQLEVTDYNEVALNLYESLGFETRRKLLTLDGEDKPSIDVQHPVTDIKAEHALSYYDAFHTIPAPWKRHQHSLSQLSRTHRAWMMNQAAYAIGYAWGGIIYLDDVGFLPGEEAIFGQLLTAMQSEDVLMRVHNLADNEPAWDVMQSLGYEAGIIQHEMWLNLAEA